MNSGFVLVLSGPSGVGKDTVINELLKNNKGRRYGKQQKD